MKRAFSLGGNGSAGHRCSVRLAAKPRTNILRRVSSLSPFLPWSICDTRWWLRPSGSWRRELLRETKRRDSETLDWTEQGPSLGSSPLYVTWRTCIRRSDANNQRHSREIFRSRSEIHGELCAKRQQERNACSLVVFYMDTDARARGCTSRKLLERALHNNMRALVFVYVFEKEGAREREGREGESSGCASAFLSTASVCAELKKEPVNAAARALQSQRKGCGGGVLCVLEDSKRRVKVFTGVPTMIGESEDKAAATHC